jgi:hypothetical protein
LTGLTRIPTRYPGRPISWIVRLPVYLGVKGALSYHQCHSCNAYADIMSAIPYGNSRTVRRRVRPACRCVHGLQVSSTVACRMRSWLLRWPRSHWRRRCRRGQDDRFGWDLPLRLPGRSLYVIPFPSDTFPLREPVQCYYSDTASMSFPGFGVNLPPFWELWWRGGWACGVRRGLRRHLGPNRIQPMSECRKEE